MAKRAHWTIARPLLFGGAIRGAPVFTDRGAAAERANDENRHGAPGIKGRGVKAVPCDEFGNVIWSRVR